VASVLLGGLSRVWRFGPCGGAGEARGAAASVLFGGLSVWRLERLAVWAAFGGAGVWRQSVAGSFEVQTQAFACVKTFLPLTPPPPKKAPTPPPNKTPNPPKEHIDYDLVESTNPAFGRAVVRVNVYRNHRQVGVVGGWCFGGGVINLSPAAHYTTACFGVGAGSSRVCGPRADQPARPRGRPQPTDRPRPALTARPFPNAETPTDEPPSPTRPHQPPPQTVQYIQPQHHARLAQAELLVIDEAAAIPLPVVRAMLGPYLVFLCSTVNGWVKRQSNGGRMAVKAAKRGVCCLLAYPQKGAGASLVGVGLSQGVRACVGQGAACCLRAAPTPPPSPANSHNRLRPEAASNPAKPPLPCVTR
jgi:hypothetical protein